MNKKSECEQAIHSLAREWFEALSEAARRRCDFAHRFAGTKYRDGGGPAETKK
jgi:hypothetical protein